MKLIEYQAKEIFRNYGILTPKEYLSENPIQTINLGKEIGFPLVLKAQVSVGGRGKAGGVKLVNNDEELEKNANQIFGLNIKGCIVNKVLVSEVIPHQNEYYLSITLDRGSGVPVLVCSSAGGIDIEEISKNEPEKIERNDYDLIVGLKEYKTREIFNRLFSNISNRSSLYYSFFELLEKLIDIYFREDATLVEINPLVISDNKLIALDAKILIDDNAFYKHPSFEKIREKTEDETLQEKMAREAGLTYISLDGDIACIVNGAGLAMATMDLVKYWGGEPANFLDIGGSSNPDKMLNALRILLSNEKVKVVLINIFGGITRCDDIAKGLLEAIRTLDINLPMSIRLIGTNDGLAKDMLSDTGISVFSDMDEAIKNVVYKAKGGNI